MPKMTDPSVDVPVALLKELFTYVPDDPHKVYLYWAQVRRGRATPGDAAGNVNKTSKHIQVRVRGRAIPAARIIIAMHDPTERWPMEPVRFRDGNPENLSLDNLFTPSMERAEPHRNLVARELRKVNKAVRALLEAPGTYDQHAAEWQKRKMERAYAKKDLDSYLAQYKASGADEDDEEHLKTVAKLEHRLNTATRKVRQIFREKRKALRGDHPHLFSERHLRPSGRPRRAWR